MMRLRPIRSESRPKTTKNGVPSASAAATSGYASRQSRFSGFCRKVSA